MNTVPVEESTSLFSRILKFIANYPDLFLNYGIGLILVALLLLFLGFSLVTFLSAYIADIEKRNLSLSFLITFLNILFLLIFSLSFSIVPIFGTIIGFFVGIIAMFWIIKISFKTSFRKALIVLVFYWFWNFFIVLSVFCYLFFRTFPIDIFKEFLFRAYQ